MTTLPAGVAGSLFWQFNDKCCPPARQAVTLRRNFPAMRLDQLLRNRQSQPAVDAVTARFVSTPETVEDEGDIFGCDSRTRILDLDPYASFLADN